MGRIITDYLFRKGLPSAVCTPFEVTAEETITYTCAPFTATVDEIAAIPAFGVGNLFNVNNSLDDIDIYDSTVTFINKFIDAPSADFISEIHFSDGIGGILLSSQGTNSNMYLSLNGGSSFSAILENRSIIKVFANNKDLKYIYVSINNVNETGGEDYVLRSDNYGASFSQINFISRNGQLPQGSPNNFISGVKTSWDGSIGFVSWGDASGNSCLSMTTDYGATWSDITSSGLGILTDGSFELVASDFAISYNGQYVYVVNSGGYYYKSSDYGATWSSPTPNIPISSYLGVECSYSGQHVYSLDRNKFYYSHDYGVTWTLYTFPENLSSDNFSVSNSGQYVYIEDGGFNSDRYVSTDYGVSFTHYANKPTYRAKIID